MATTIRNFSVGMIVYRIYQSHNPGKILRLVNRGRAEIRWLKPKKGEPRVTVERDIFGLRDFDALITDHEKKLETHRHLRGQLNQFGEPNKEERKSDGR